MCFLLDPDALFPPLLEAKVVLSSFFGDWSFSLLLQWDENPSNVLRFRSLSSPLLAFRAWNCLSFFTHPGWADAALLSPCKTKKFFPRVILLLAARRLFFPAVPSQCLSGSLDFSFGCWD